ncbi:hypothetical protein [Cytophaga hutchinsonii]|uniref:Uncharacterized protein n=1 Tax=Cytophaga hutchinsonii (strain ATCC 33406 / DSM 1761 / CIP 103989 / NBRC 15051 / NCIMB 9469 / D465) TaxID=269798 RepID=A0A6N4SSG1_CYTH3|nr:hypothetical protein [Cytophaga hutchinsonii]ABG59280.1 hypothetical protein CHU_2014 [Cytophaga hutchinsonii ATCC 33406]
MRNILLGFKMTMAVIYTAIGIYLITHPNALAGLVDGNMTLIIGILLILFGSFRGYRAWFIERNM